MKKIIIFTISTVIIFLLSINIYVLTSRNSIETSVENLNLIKSKISSLDNFRTNIVQLAHMQKSFLLTGDESFKVQYTHHLNSSYSMIEDFLTENIITNVDKENLTATLKNYDEINNTLLKVKPTLPLNKEIEDLLLKSNSIQVELLHQVSLAIANKTDVSINSSNSITNSIDSQKNFIQILSSFFTLLISGPVYYISKKYKNGEIKFDGIVSAMKYEGKKQDDCSNMLAYATLLSKHNLSMEKQWQEVEELVDLLQKSVIELNLKLRALSSDNVVELRDIELQIISIRLLIKQLPNYHEIIVQLSDNIINLQNK